MQSRRVRVRVRGRVQGVSYRASTQTRAQELGLTGWVRNDPPHPSDGPGRTQVTLEAQGASAAVDALIAWCRRGPSAARVDALDLEDIAPLQSERGFRIARS